MAAAPQQMQPKWQLNRNSRAQQGLTEDLEAQKRMMEKQLKDRAQRLSRISVKLQSSGAGNLNNKLKEFEVQQMAAQLAELHDNMKTEEQARREAERAQKQREDEMRAVAQRTGDLNQMYRSMDPKAADPMLDARAQKRRTALLSMKATGAFSEQELAAMEAKEKAQEDAELARSRAQQEATERKLREMEAKVKQTERQREEERLKRQAEQLRMMEAKMAAMERAMETGEAEEAIQSEADLQREIERRQREALERRERERKERERILLEEERVRRERDEALFKKKMEMERKMREMENALAEKQRQKEEEALARQQEKLLKMQAALNSLDDEAGVTALQTDVEARRLQQKVAMLENQLKSGGGGGGGGGGLSAEQLAAIEQRERALDERAKQMDAMMSKLSELDKLQALVSTLAGIVAGGGLAGGGGGMRPMGGGGGNSVAELKAEIEAQQKILFDPNSTEKQIEEANIKLEKAMSEYEKTGEYQQELIAQKAAKRAKHEIPNKEALKKMKLIYNPQNVKSNPDLLAKIGDNPELRLLFMEHETIMKLHVSDFKAFSLRGLSLEELRAIRANLPPWRKDQKVQVDWTDSLDNKIDEMADRPQGLDKPIKSSGKPLVIKKSAGGGGGDIFAELLAKKNGMKPSGGGGGDGGARSGGNPNPPLPKSLPTKLPPLPKMALPPPGPPGGGSAAAPAAAAPAAPAAPAVAAGGPPPQAAIDQYKKVKVCLEKLLKGLVTGSSTEKEIASDTRNTVQEIKALARIQKAKEPQVCGECEDSASELVVAVKAVLVAKKGGGADLTQAKQKLAGVIDTVRNLAIKTLGPDGRNYIR